MLSVALNGGDQIAEVLKAHRVPFLYTLCGGHISPILVGCKARGIRVVDVRHEATAVFAADATARLTGVPGVAAVTAGPGITNTITAIKNAQMAQSPVILLGGAAPTVLKGRGALQDIDQMVLLKPHVKWAKAVRKVRDLAPAVNQAIYEAQSGVPGPVFVECPLDLLYAEETVREFYGVKASSKSLANRALQFYLQWHLNRIFAGADHVATPAPVQVKKQTSDQRKLQQVAEKLQAAQRPVLLIGSQALSDTAQTGELAQAVVAMGIPTYLSGMARGLLGQNNPIQMRHKRRNALREADLVMLAGVPCDFRLDYGNHIPRRATYISINRSRTDLRKNRRPSIGVLGDPGNFLIALSQQVTQAGQWASWRDTLRQRDEERNVEIAQQALQPTGKVNPLHLCQELASATAPETIFVADGGDFVATASYIVNPPGPLTWLDPGPFGTLGVGAGFALAAKLCRPQAEVWLLYGDGSAGYSLTEFDTFARHNVPVIAVVGNDAGWTQIARDQVDILQDDVGTVLEHTDYHSVAQGFGGNGLQLEDPELIGDTLQQAKIMAQNGSPVLVNAILGKTDFRKGSISV